MNIFFPDISDGLSSYKELKVIAEKVQDGKRISPSEGLILFNKAPLGLLSSLAEEVCKRFNGGQVFYIRNFHIEPTNICAYHCRFCSYSRKAGENGAWELSMEEIRQIVMDADPNAREVHITGGAHPERNLEYYGDLISIVRQMRPAIHIKAFSAVEIDHLHDLSGRTYEAILKHLAGCGLNSIPGGGAEIFDRELRSKICPEKVDADGWLKIHRTAHLLGLPTNATMLYAHMENYGHRMDHMDKIRQLQDETRGFQAFIPLKFRNLNNRMSHIPELPLLHDLRNYAVSRIFLDNISHIKAYWPMLGKSNAQLALFFGVDDLDGTIEDSTKIYSLAGVDERPMMTAEDISLLITQTGKTPVERDAVYRPVISENIKSGN